MNYELCIVNITTFDLMKHWLTILGIVGYKMAMAQTLVPADFAAFANCANATCFEDLAIAHGYTPVLYSSRSGVYTEPGGSNCAENSVGYLNKGISYTTLSANRYKELAEGFAKLGFSNLIKEGKKINTLSRSAKQQGLLLTVISYPTTDKCGMPCTGFNITLERK